MEPNNEKKKCSYCGEEIPAQAGRCPFCGSLLEVSVDNCSVPVHSWEPAREPAVNDVQKENINETAPVQQNKVPQQNTAPQQNVTPQQNISSQQYSSYRDNQGQQTAGYRPVTNPVGQPVVQQQHTSPSGSLRQPLSNGMKVFLTLLFAFIPGLGQLAGIITAIVFMNTDDDPDRKSFGVALLVATLIMFVLSCIGCFTIIILYSIGSGNFYGY